MDRHNRSKPFQLEAFIAVELGYVAFCRRYLFLYEDVLSLEFALSYLIENLIRRVIVKVQPTIESGNWLKDAKPRSVCGYSLLGDPMEWS